MVGMVVVMLLILDLDIKTKFLRGWGVTSVSKVFALQALKPKLNL